MVYQKMSMRKTMSESNVYIFLLYLTYTSRYKAEELLMHEKLMSLVPTFKNTLFAYGKDLGELEN